MAITIGDAILYLRGDDSGLEQDLGSAEQKTTRWASQAGGNISRVLGGVLVAGIATAVVGGLAAVGGAALSMGNQADLALGRIRSELGLFEDEAGLMADQVVDLWKRGFGESMDDATGAMITARQNLQRLNETGEDLGDVTAHAIALRDAFGVDIAESTRTVDRLMNEMGITAEESFALIASGMQNGVNRSGDLLDTLTEYSNDFQNLGFTADETLAALNSGLEAGFFNTDKVADAVREWGINMLDAGRLAPIQGINAELDETIALFQQGQLEGPEAFQAVQQALASIEDPLQRQQAGVALFGSMWEDFGQDAVLGISVAEDAMLDQSNALDALNQQYDNLGNFVEQMKRRAMAALEPLGGLMLGLANRIGPMLEEQFGKLESFLAGPLTEAAQIAQGALNTFFFTMQGRDELAENFAQASELARVARELGVSLRDTLIPTIQSFVGQLREALAPSIERIVTAFQDAFGGGRSFSEWFTDVLLPAIEQALPIILGQLVPTIDMLAQGLAWLAEQVLPLLASAWAWVTDNLNIVLPILGVVAAAVLAFTSPITLIIGLVGALAMAWANNWGNIQGIMQSVILWFQTNVVPVWQSAMAGLQRIIDVFSLAIEGRWFEFGVALRKLLADAVENVLGVFKRLRERGRERMQAFIDNAKAVITETDWIALGQSIMQGIIQGLQNMGQAIKDALLDLVLGGVQFVQGFLGIKSPSDYTRDEIGVPMLQGPIEAFRSMAGEVQQAFFGALAPPSLAGQGAGGLGGGGDTFNLFGGVNINFGRGPETQAEADQMADRIYDGLKKKGRG